MNIDGACSNVGSKLACEGVVRNSVGDWIGGFSMQIESKGILNVELVRILLGIRMVKELKIDKIHIGSSNVKALNLVRFGCLFTHPCYNIVKQIEEVLSSGMEVKYNLVYREYNGMVDMLAKIVSRQN